MNNNQKENKSWSFKNERKRIFFFYSHFLAVLVDFGRLFEFLVFVYNFRLTRRISRERKRGTSRFKSCCIVSMSGGSGVGVSNTAAHTISSAESKTSCILLPLDTPYLNTRCTNFCLHETRGRRNVHPLMGSHEDSYKNKARKTVHRTKLYAYVVKWGSVIDLLLVAISPGSALNAP